MRYHKILPHAAFIILVIVFVLINNSGFKSGLKQGKVIQSPSIITQSSVVREVARVLKVIDGDTIEVSLNNKMERIRLIGIDSPEVKDERKPVQCFGKEASAKARELLSGKTIILESDPTQNDRDEYGRLLRYVFLDDLNFNKLMLREGYAREYTFKGKVYKYRPEFIQTGKGAMRNNRGLWASC